MIACAQEVYSSRKGEQESEDVILVMQETAKKAIGSGMFSAASGEAGDIMVNLDFLEGNEMKEYCEASVEAVWFRNNDWSL